MDTIKWVAKAITGFVTVGLGAAATYNLDVNPWILVFGSALVGGLAVFLVPNSDRPTE